MFTRVLAPLDGSPAATERLQDIGSLCKYFGAKLVLLTVIDAQQRETMLVDLPTGPISARGERINQEDLDQRVRLYLDRAMTIVSRVGIEVSSEQIVANAEVGILRAASDLNCDLIAVSPNTHQTTHRIFLGSTTERIVRSSPIPVLDVKEGTGKVFSLAGEEEAGGGTVLVPLDGSEDAEAVLGFASALATRMGFGLKITTVVPPVLESGVAGEFELELIGRDLTEYLSSLTDQAAQDGGRTDYEVAFGDPASEFIKMADRLRNPIVVISTRRRSATSARMISSFIERVGRRLSHPMIAVPRDYEGK